MRADVFPALQRGAVTGIELTKAAQPVALFANDAGVALGGFDPVTYFNSDILSEGSRDNALIWRGVIWYFSSAETLRLFEANPHAYAPKFGGYCALALAYGKLKSSDPVNYSIREEGLYLFHTQNAKQIWMQDAEKYTLAAFEHWPGALR